MPPHGARSHPLLRLRPHDSRGRRRDVARLAHGRLGAVSGRDLLPELRVGARVGVAPNHSPAAEQGQADTPQPAVPPVGTGGMPTGAGDTPVASGAPAGPGGTPVASGAPAGVLDAFPSSTVIGEGRGRRAWRLLRASVGVLREDPQLLVFPAVAMTASLAVGAICFALSVSSFGTPREVRGLIFIASLIAAYPVNFVSLYCGVALATVLAGRLEGEATSPGDGWKAASERTGMIAGWTLLVCTVGALLRTIEQYVPLGGKLAAAVLDLSWSLATMFAVPVLAYENIGPLDTLRRSSQIFRQRWGTQLRGVVGIGIGGALLTLPPLIVLIIGALTPGGEGILLVVLGGAGLFGALALQIALDQIFRVFVYRSAVGLDTRGAPFTQADLQAPFAARRRRS